MMKKHFFPPFIHFKTPFLVLCVLLFCCFFVVSCSSKEETFDGEYISKDEACSSKEKGYKDKEKEDKEKGSCSSNSSQGDTEGTDTDNTTSSDQNNQGGDNSTSTNPDNSSNKGDPVVGIGDNVLHPNLLNPISIPFGTVNSHDYIKGLSIDSSGDIYVLGEDSYPGYNILISKYNSLGELQWMKQVGTSGYPKHKAYGITTAQSGDFYILGSKDVYSRITSSYRHTSYLKRYNSLGVEKDETNFGLVNKDYTAIAMGGESVYVAGGKQTVQWEQRPYINQYTLSGVGLSSIAPDSFGTYKNYRASRITLDSSGNIYMTGTLFATSKQFPYISKFSPLGVRLWMVKSTQISAQNTGQVETYNGSANGIAVDSLGNVYITGSRSRSFYDWVIRGPYLTKFNSSGTRQWEKKVNNFDLPTVHGEDIVLDKSGNIYITGGNTFNKGYTAKYTPSGVREWFIQRGGYNRNIVFDPNGFIYIAGDTKGGINSDNGSQDEAYILKYDLDGKQIW